MLLQKHRNAFRMVLRFSDDIMHIRIGSDLLIYGSASLPVARANAADASLAPLDLCHLFDEMFATGAAISGFR